MRIPRVTTIDYETEGIESRPDYPPKPVGVAIKSPGRAGFYMAWGHPCENNCTKAEAKSVLKGIFRHECCLFHNSAFDIEVGMEYLGLPMPPMFHDTLFLAFLHDPHELSLRLKYLGDVYLNMPPIEQDKLNEWILNNVDECKKISQAGAYISKAPGKLVGTYAIGDVKRTEALFKLFYPYVFESDMMEAYIREIRLMPIKIGMEQQGIPIALRRLKRDIKLWKIDFEKTEKSIYRKLGGSFNIGSGGQLAEKLTKKKLVKSWIYTDPTDRYPNGSKSTAIESLEETLLDKNLLVLLQRRSVLNKYIGTYGEPWIERASACDGYLYPRINQVRGDYHKKDGDKPGGAYTGRFSMFDPSLHNTPRNPEDDTLPFLRNYIIPDDGCVLNVRDYSQQEVRIFAHFEDGSLCEAYNENPTMDAHDTVRQIILEMLMLDYIRMDVKTTNFGIIYGQGVAALARRMKKPKEEVAKLKAAIMKAIPGIKRLMRELADAAAHDEPIRTWGGRLYFVQDPKVVKGVLRTFEYKLINTLIQGSAADCTKQAMININDNCSNRIMLQVHDELVMSVVKLDRHKEMAKMKEAMEDVEFKVPMLTDGKCSARSWGEVRPCS